MRHLSLRLNAKTDDCADANHVTQRLPRDRQQLLTRCYDDAPDRKRTC